MEKKKQNKNKNVRLREGQESSKGSKSIWQKLQSRVREKF